MSADADEGGPQTERREIEDALIDMKQAKNAYFYIRNQKARDGINPDEDAEVFEALVEFHTTVMYVFDILQPDIRDRLEDDYWDADLVQLGESEKHIGLSDLPGWYDLTTYEIGEQYVEDQGWVDQPQFSATMPAHTLLQEVSNKLHEAAKELGYGASPRVQTDYFNSDIKELKRELWEWRQSNGFETPLE